MPTINGTTGSDTLTGTAGDDIVNGLAGDDHLFGENGDDDLTAGLTSSTADRIMDFSQAEGDIIRLDGVDANSALGGDQAFAFIGSGVFTGTAGELRYFQSGSITYVQGDTDGDGVGDFMIRLDGPHTLGQSDFVL